MRNATWKELAERYLGGGGMRRYRFPPGSVALTPPPAGPVDAAATRAWVRGALFETHFLPMTVCKQCLEWPVYTVAYRVRPTTNDRTQGQAAAQATPQLTVLCAPGPSALKRETERVRTALLPLLLACTDLLRDPSVTSSPYKVFLDKPAPRVMYIAIHAPKRQLPTLPGGAVLPENINGGLTMHARNTKWPVIVYRAEDSGKVLVHELLHYHCIDARLWPTVSLDVAAAERAVAERYGVLSAPPVQRLGLNEAFTETLACYLHAHWWHHNQPQKAAKSPCQHTMQLLRRHIDRVAGRLLRHFGRGSIISAPQQQQQPRIADGTHVFSYVVCKAALWTDIDRFLDAFPPWFRPDVSTFVPFLDAAIAAYRAPALPPPQNTRSNSLMMTCLQ